MGEWGGGWGEDGELIWEGNTGVGGNSALGGGGGNRGGSTVGVSSTSKNRPLHTISISISLQNTLS